MDTPATSSTSASEDAATKQPASPAHSTDPAHSTGPAHPASPAHSAPVTASHLVAPSLREALSAPTVGEKLTQLMQWWPTTRLARTLERYFGVDGDLMASGLALTILISLTAALTVVWTIFMAVLGTYDEIREATLEAIASNLPGLIDTPSSPGLVNPDDLVSSSAWTPTSIVAFLVMAWTGTGLVGRLGRSLRTVFGLVVLPESIVKFYLRNLVGAIFLALALLLGVGVGLVVDVARDWLFGVLSIELTPLTGVLVWVVSLIVPFFVNMGVGFILIQVVAGIRPPKKDLLWGLVLMAAASTLLRVAGTSVVSSVSGPLLTTATTLVTLVLWINLQMRLTLMVAAWMANPPRALPISDPEHMRFEERPNYVTMSVPATLEWPRHMITGDLAPAPIPPSLPSSPLPFFDLKPARTLRSWLFGPSEIAQRAQARARQESTLVDNYVQDEADAAALSTAPGLPAENGGHEADASPVDAVQEPSDADWAPESAGQNEFGGEAELREDASDTGEELSDAQRRERADVKEQDANFEGQAPSA